MLYIFFIRLCLFLAVCSSSRVLNAGEPQQDRQQDKEAKERATYASVEELMKSMEREGYPSFKSDSVSRLTHYLARLHYLNRLSVRWPARQDCTVHPGHILKLTPSPADMLELTPEERSYAVKVSGELRDFFKNGTILGFDIGFGTRTGCSDVREYLLHRLKRDISAEGRRLIYDGFVADDIFILRDKDQKICATIDGQLQPIRNWYGYANIVCRKNIQVLELRRMILDFMKIRVERAHKNFEHTATFSLSVPKDYTDLLAILDAIGLKRFRKTIYDSFSCTSRVEDSFQQEKIGGKTVLVCQYSFPCENRAPFTEPEDPVLGLLQKAQARQAEREKQEKEKKKKMQAAVEAVKTEELSQQQAAIPTVDASKADPMPVITLSSNPKIVEKDNNILLPPSSPLTLKSNSDPVSTVVSPASTNRLPLIISPDRRGSGPTNTPHVSSVPLPPVALPSATNSVLPNNSIKPQAPSGTRSRTKQRKEARQQRINTIYGISLLGSAVAIGHGVFNPEHRMKSFALAGVLATGVGAHKVHRYLTAK